MKIVVCGDSFCSADSTSERWHFSQMLEDKYHYEVINLARGGISNTGICYQLKKALDLNPDYVVYNITDPARVDISMHEHFYSNIGLKNFIYHSPDDSSYGSEYVGDINSAILSIVPAGLGSMKHFSVPEEKIQAVKYYFAHLFNWQLKNETDRWLVDYWQTKLIQKGIKVISLGSTTDSPPNPIGNILYDFVEQHPEFRIRRLYHTDRDTQELVADALFKKISSNT